MSKTEPRANLRDYMLGAVDNVTRKARVLSCKLEREKVCLETSLTTPARPADALPTRSRHDSLPVLSRPCARRSRSSCSPPLRRRTSRRRILSGSPPCETAVSVPRVPSSPPDTRLPPSVLLCEVVPLCSIPSTHAIASLFLRVCRDRLEKVRARSVRHSRQLALEDGRPSVTNT